MFFRMYRMTRADARSSYVIKQAGKTILQIVSGMDGNKVVFVYGDYAAALCRHFYARKENIPGDWRSERMDGIIVGHKFSLGLKGILANEMLHQGFYEWVDSVHMCLDCIEYRLPSDSVGISKVGYEVSRMRRHSIFNGEKGAGYDRKRSQVILCDMKCYNYFDPTNRQFFRSVLDDVKHEPYFEECAVIENKSDRVDGEEIPWGWFSNSDISLPDEVIAYILDLLGPADKADCQQAIGWGLPRCCMWIEARLFKWNHYGCLLRIRDSTGVNFYENGELMYRFTFGSGNHYESLAIFNTKQYWSYKINAKWRVSRTVKERLLVCNNQEEANELNDPMRASTYKALRWAGIPPEIKDGGSCDLQFMDLWRKVFSPIGMLAVLFNYHSKHPNIKAHVHHGDTKAYSICKTDAHIFGDGHVEQPIWYINHYNWPVAVGSDWQKMNLLREHDSSLYYDMPMSIVVQTTVVADVMHLFDSFTSYRRGYECSISVKTDPREVRSLVTNMLPVLIGLYPRQFALNDKWRPSRRMR